MSLDTLNEIMARRSPAIPDPRICHDTSGDVANKIGTYLKALAAKDNNVPFYVAFGSSGFDWQCSDGVRGIPIEQRGSAEVQRP